MHRWWSCRAIGAQEHGGIKGSGLFLAGDTNRILMPAGERHTGKACRQKESFMQMHDVFSGAQDDEQKW